MRRAFGVACLLVACQRTPAPETPPRSDRTPATASTSAAAPVQPPAPRSSLIAETPEAQAAARRAQELWGTVALEPHRASLENYVPVARDRELPLNDARGPFAKYLHEFHARIHGVFADQFVRSLELLPASHFLNQPGLFTRLEIVLEPAEGRVVRMGVIIPSGVTPFDVGALEAVRRAQPFGPAPHAIVSPDGQVYFHQSFYRLPTYACSTYFAWPILRAPSPETPPDGSPAL